MFHVIFLNDGDISSKTLHMNKIYLKNYIHLGDIYDSIQTVALRVHCLIYGTSKILER